MSAQPSRVVSLIPGTYKLHHTLVTDHFLDGAGATSVSITGETNRAAVQKIRENAELAGDEFIVDKISTPVTAGAQNITFLTGSGSATFKGSGSAYAELAVFPDPGSASFRDAMGPIADTGFGLTANAADTVVLLRWGADARVAGSGSIALSAGASIDFGAHANGELFFGVLQQTARTTRTNDALAAVVSNWRLPAQVRTAADLAPRTHLLSEVGGRLQTAVSATIGYDFNWLRQITTGGKQALAGDIGLKLQLGLKASFGVGLQGKFAVVVSRETEAETIRIRIFKLRMKDFDCAFSASAEPTGIPSLPSDYHDLLKAALGVHPLQILQDLQDPNAIPNMRQQFGADYVTALLKDFTGFDADQAGKTVTGFVERWKKLPHSIASLFAKMAEKEVPDFSQILKLATMVRDGDTAALKTLLEKTINDSKAPFLNTPAGQFLEALAEHGALTLVERIPDVAKKAAGQTVDFLTGTSVEALLNRIETTVEQRLGIGTILNLTNKDVTSGLDPLLNAKLKGFLGKTPATADLVDLQNHIRSVLDKAGPLYTKTVKALSGTYTAHINAIYDQTTTDTALVDAEFDFSGDSQDAVTGAMAELLHGRVADFLMHPVNGVKLNSGALTHKVVRHTHADLTLPFAKIESDWTNQAAASLNAMDAQNGRLLLFHLDAKDQRSKKNTLTSLWHGRNWRGTTLTLAAQLSQLIPASGGVAVHIDSDHDAKRFATAVASMNMDVQNMSRNELIQNIEPFAIEFLRKAFADKAAFERWVSAGRLLAEPGNALVSLNVALPPEAPLAWINNTITDKNNDVYMAMSRLVQLAMRDKVYKHYFRNVDRFAATMPASVVLLYRAVAPSNSIVLAGVPAGGTDIYWDPLRDEEFDAMAGQARDTFATLLRGARDRLAAGRLTSAGFYDPATQANRRFQEATTEPGRSLLKNLLQAERIVVEAARDAAVDIAQAKLKMDTDPQSALALLTDAGGKLTEAFNADLSNLFVDDIDALQRLSPLIFCIASRAFDASVPLAQNNSTLNVTVLKAGVAMPDTFPEFNVANKDIALSLNAASFV